MKKKELDEMDVPIPVINQMKNSELELIGYTEEGSQLVKNVLLANDNRENNRRDTDNRERDIRLKAVEFEAEIANNKFMEISCQWPIIFKKNDALEINEHLELQKKRVLDLIEQKNQMIEILKRDLAESDSRFLHEQAAQSEDVRILQERIEIQLKFIRKQYKNHIQYIQTTIDQQRECQINKSNEGWKNLYNEIILVESNSLDYRLAMIDKKENNIMKQYEMNEETLRNLKSDMNTEFHYIQREFELIKMRCVENVEKLNYNYQVLKRREEENAYAKATQRRKINKLQDILSTKRMILRESKTKFNAKVSLLQDEIEKLKQDIKQHDNKSERLAEIQEKTYKELWNFSQEQITNYLGRIFKIDQIIYETQLGIEWQPPRKVKYSDVSNLPSYRKKLNTSSAKNLHIENDQSAVNSYVEIRERALLQLVFDKTIKNASSILDNELIEILKSHSNRNLTLLYNVMAAYGLNSTDSWKCLLSYTQSMVTCAICRGPVLWYKNDLSQPTKVNSELKTESENKLIDNVLMFTDNHSKYIEKIVTTTTIKLKKTHSKHNMSLLKQKPTRIDVNNAVETNEYQSLVRENTDSDNSTITFSLSLTDFEQLCSENDSNSAMKSQQSFSHEGLKDYYLEFKEQNNLIETTALKFSQNQNTEEKDFIVQGRPCDNPHHPLMMKDTDYLRAIKKTIDISKLKIFDKQTKNKSEFYLMNTLNIKDIQDYWKQFLYAFPEDRLKLWDLFNKAIKKYYQTLHLRFKKMKEVDKLESENMELKTILKQFMDAEQDDVRLQNICTPKIRKQHIHSPKINLTKPAFSDDSAKVCGTSIHIFTVNRLSLKK